MNSSFSSLRRNACDDWRPLFSGGVANDQRARAALLGTEKKPALTVSGIFRIHEYEAITQVEIRDLSPDQLRIWRNGAQTGRRSLSEHCRRQARE